MTPQGRPIQANTAKKVRTPKDKLQSGDSDLVREYVHMSFPTCRVIFCVFFNALWWLPWVEKKRTKMITPEFFFHPCLGLGENCSPSV